MTTSLTPCSTSPSPLRRPAGGGEAGWVVQYRDGMNVYAGRGVAVREFRLAKGHGFADYLLFVEHFADQAAYQEHTSSAAYRDLIAGQFADRIVEFVEINHELVVSV